LLRELKTFLEDSLDAEDICRTPFIICADMNSLIDSGAIEFVEQGKIPVSHPDFQKLKYGGFLAKCIEKEKKGSIEMVSHPFELSRVGKENELPFSNYTYDFSGLLDYIFYTKKELVPLGELGPIDMEYLRKNKVVGFPPLIFLLIIYAWWWSLISNYLQGSKNIDQKYLPQMNE